MDRGGAGEFFRRAIGLSTFIEIKDGKGQIIEKRLDFEHRTILELELKICSEYLGGMTHMVFEKLPRSEKLKWYLYEELTRKREEYISKKELAEMNKIRNT